MTASSARLPSVVLDVRRHALGWLVAGNAAGVVLAALLVWPALNGPLAPLTFGRWAPVHHNLQLYGWSAMPLVGVLLLGFLHPAHPAAPRHARVALSAWSLALALGAASWLGGVASGKLYVDWHGWARPLLPGAMLVLWTLLAAHLWWSWRDGRFAGRALAGRLALLAGLLPVAPLFLLASGREIFPPINPGTGGATGTSLLGSTLGLLTILGLLPWLLRVPRDAARPARGPWPYAAALAGSWLVYLFLDHGNASHDAPGQIAGLALLLAWVPLAHRFARRYAWPAACTPWLRAASAWWALLVVSGWLTFLPGPSALLKFSHGLVAHAHLAMACWLTAVLHVLLNALGTGGRTAGGRSAFVLWQAGAAVHLAALALLAAAESSDPAALFLGDPGVGALLGLRLLAGVAMLAASALWLRSSWIPNEGPS